MKPEVRRRKSEQVHLLITYFIIFKELLRLNESVTRIKIVNFVLQKAKG